MTDVLDLQGLPIERAGPHCPSVNSVVLVMTTFHLA
ncbi:hypothetical protein BXY51_008715 [Actinoplanes cyaneus]|nr:hypothetical protein [Actinoplanes cyaneus]